MLPLREQCVHRGLRQIHGLLFMSLAADLHGDPGISDRVQQEFEAEVARGGGPAAVKEFGEIPCRLERADVAAREWGPQAAAQFAAMEQRLLRECETYMAGAGAAAAVRAAEAVGQSLRAEICSLELVLAGVNAEREQRRERFARSEQELTAAWAILVEQAVTSGVAVAEAKYK